MVRTNVLALWVCLAALAVAGLAWRAARGALPELEFRCAAHACACRDVLVCLTDCCCEPHSHNDGRTKRLDATSAHRNASSPSPQSSVPFAAAFASHATGAARVSAVARSATAGSRALDVDATLAPARCGGRADERVATTSPSVPALVAERGATPPAQTSTGRAPKPRAEHHEATVIEPPSPPPRGTRDAA